MLTASNAGKFKDRSPDLNAAGKLFSTVDESISHLMKDSKRPQTPPEIHQWRNSAQSEPGKSVRHAGCFHDAYPDARLGRRNDYSETANGCLKVEKTHVQSLLEANREKIYLSSKIEPLGRSMTRDHQLPPITETRTFAFGVTSNKSENAKDVIYPIVKREEEVKNEVLLHQLYIRSHASYDPGEQKKRSYEWKQPNIDWSLHAFGRPCLSRKSHSDTVGFCLHPPTDQNQTWVVKKTDADFRDYVADHLGKSKHTVKSSVHTNHPGYPDTKNPCMTTKSVIEIRNKMSTPHMHPDNKNIPGITRTMSASHVSIASPEPGSVAEALHAGYDVGSPDDCGQQTSSLTRTCRRNLPEHLHKGVYHIRDMVHGMPTVRNDLKKPLFRKVTSAINYGDEPNAKQLLNPSVRTRGLTGEEDWNVPVEKEQLRTIVLSPQFGLSESTFQQCWEQVARQGKATVTYRTFFEQLKQQEKDVYL